MGGQRYAGSFSHGTMDGQGRYEWPDGTVYEGAFAANRIAGSGRFSWPDGSTYEGEVRDGLRHGSGTFTAGCGAVYEGEWRSGLRHGTGTLWYDRARSASYAGAWVRGRRHGEGRMAYAGGGVYEGSWADDERDGLGTMRWGRGGHVYRGSWRRGAQHGRGAHVWAEPAPARGEGRAQRPACNRYEGSWAEGRRHGEGLLRYSSGASYEGSWHQDQKHGFGAFAHEDGRLSVGDFEGDRMAGGLRRPPPPAHLRLHLDDLLLGRTAAEKGREAALCERAALRYASECRGLYAYFAEGAAAPPAARGTGLEPDPYSFAMPLHRFWAAAAAVGLVDDAYGLADVGAALAAMRRERRAIVAAAVLRRGEAGLGGGASKDPSDREDGGGGADPGAPAAFGEVLDPSAERNGRVEEGLLDPRTVANPHEPLLLREFAELLVRCAIEKQRSSRPLPPARGSALPRRGAAPAVAALMEGGVLPACLRLGLLQPPPAGGRSADGGSARRGAGRQDGRRHSRSEAAPAEDRSGGSGGSGSSGSGSGGAPRGVPAARWSRLATLGDAAGYDMEAVLGAAGVLLREDTQAALRGLLARFASLPGAVLTGADLLRLLRAGGVVRDARPVLKALGSAVASFSSLAAASGLFATNGATPAPGGSDTIGAPGPGRFGSERGTEEEGEVPEPGPGPGRGPGPEVLLYRLLPVQALEVLALLAADLLSGEAEGTLAAPADGFGSAAALAEAMVEGALKPLAAGRALPPTPGRFAARTAPPPLVA